MAKSINLNILFALNIIQPVSAKRLSDFYSSIMTESNIVNLEYIEEQIDILLSKHLIAKSNEKPPQEYSLTEKGLGNFSPKNRHRRDLLRIILLNRAKKIKVKSSCSEDMVADGETPSLKLRTNLQMPATIENKVYFQWRRSSKKYNNDLRNTSFSGQDIYLKNLSYSNSISIEKDAIDRISLLLGISRQLIHNMTKSNIQHNYYREFSIKKKSGGTRKIQAPRIFLKVVQRFVIDFVLINLPVHQNVHSYTTNKNIISNASMHKNKYILSMDIENFFGSITKEMIFEFLNKISDDRSMVDLISKISTKENVLPQGAPTSPLLSNAILYDFDEEITLECHKKNIVYTRYSDDIAISGDDLETLKTMRDFISNKLLDNYSLKLNRTKNKTMPKWKQQKVTGVVVNEKVKPSRHWMRKLRQKIYFVEKFGGKSLESLQKIQGNIAYLNSFPEYENQDLINKYKTIINDAKIKQREQKND